jgi:hypothetical protein
MRDVVADNFDSGITVKVLALLIVQSDVDGVQVVEFGSEFVVGSALKQFSAISVFCGVEKAWG